MNNQIKLNKTCLKLDKYNAKAMIEGFEKEGKNIHQAIYVVTKWTEKSFPKLITLAKTQRFKLSNIGIRLAAESYSIPLKYIAKIEGSYTVKNSMDLWKEICTNDLFDIWDPEGGPHKKLLEANSKPEKFRIFLSI